MFPPLIFFGKICKELVFFKYLIDFSGEAIWTWALSDIFLNYFFLF